MPRRQSARDKWAAEIARLESTYPVQWAALVSAERDYRAAQSTVKANETLANMGAFGAACLALESAKVDFLAACEAA